jgi:glutathione S-transferase
MGTVQIIGRTSSLFTRIALIFAEELGVAYALSPLAQLTTMNAEAYAGNPALKIPSMRDGDVVLFGAQNICRALAERGRSARIVWPETLTDALSRNAHELLAHSLTAQVQLAMGTIVCGLPADNAFFAKARAGLEGSMRWLDEHVPTVLASFPPRDLSFFEVSLHCLMEHFAMRPTLSPEPYRNLLSFSAEFAQRPSARTTAYVS